MPDIVFNVAKGRVAELYNRVDLADPAAARLYVIPINANAVSDATAQDVDTFADLITAGVTERTANGWNRKTLAAADLAAFAADDTNNRVDLDFPDQTWTSVSTDAVTDVVICYAAVATPTNAQLVPLTMHDFVVTPSGGDVTLQTPNGFFRAT